MNKTRAAFLSSSFWLSVTLVPLLFDKAYNYIDPGTGSLVFQVMISSLVGALFLAKVFWKKISAFLSRMFSRIRKVND